MPSGDATLQTTGLRTQLSGNAGEMAKFDALLIVDYWGKGQLTVSMNWFVLTTAKCCYHCATIKNK